MEPVRNAAWLLWATPAAAVLLVTVDLLGLGQVLWQGAEAAFPDPGELARVRADWLGSPDPTLWAITVAGPLLLVTGLLGLAGVRLSRTRGPALTAVGALSAGCLLLLMWGYETTPLAMMVFCRMCDAGALEQVPGPLWFRPARSVLLAAIGACLVLAMALLSRPAAAEVLRANLGGPASHRFRARDAATGATATAVCAVAIVAVSAAVSDAGAVAGYALVLIPLAVVSGWLAWRLWRGAAPRPTAVLVVGGFTAVCGFVALPAVALFGPVDLRDAAWLRGAVFIALAGQLVVLNGVFRRTTARWLAGTAPAAADGEKPGSGAGVGWTDDR